MKTKSTSKFLALVSLPLLATPVFAGGLDLSHPAFYVGAEVGRHDSILESGGFNTLGAFSNGDTDAARGSQRGIDVGARFDRLRIDLGYRDYQDMNFNTWSLAAVGYNSKIGIETFMLSATYDLYKADQVTLYAGGGAGTARLDIDTNDTVVRGSGIDNALVWQAAAGVEYAITPKLSVNSEVRHVDYSHTEIGLNAGKNGDFTADVTSSELVIGLRYML